MFHKLHIIKLVISEFIIEEVRRSSFYRQSPFRTRFANLLLSDIGIVPYPSKTLVGRARQIISEKDAPIIASAKLSKAEALVTWDKEFLSTKVERFLKIKVYLPGGYLQKLRRENIG